MGIESTQVDTGRTLYPPICASDTPQGMTHDPPQTTQHQPQARHAHAAAEDAQEAPDTIGPLSQWPLHAAPLQFEAAAQCPEPHRGGPGTPTAAPGYPGAPGCCGGGRLAKGSMPGTGGGCPAAGIHCPQLLLCWGPCWGVWQLDKWENTQHDEGKKQQQKGKYIAHRVSK